MAKIVGLPKLSPTMEEGTLARWVKAEGDQIEVDDLIAEVETDKATMEWRAFDKVVLLKILVEEGATLEPDAPVAIFGQAGEDIAALLEELETASASAADEVQEAPEPERSAPTTPVRPTAVAARPSATDAPAEAATLGVHGRVLASPLVRRTARDHGVDLRGVQGSGPGGRIIKRDLDAYLANPPAATLAATGYQRLAPRVEKLSQMRKTIARRLVESKQTVPHFYLTVDFNAGPLLSARKEINAELAADGEKASVNDFIIKAAAAALRKVPEVNASFLGDSVAYHQVVDVSMAVAVPDGLVTPVIRDADRKTIREIARETKILAAKARDKKLMPEEMTNGTFSVSNLGMLGIEEFAAVINPPEGAILAVGTLREEPVVENGAVTTGKRIRMTMSCDHRVVDGAVGARWLQAFKAYIERPLLLLL